jgi:hypothetical protein
MHRSMAVRGKNTLHCSMFRCMAAKELFFVQVADSIALLFRAAEARRQFGWHGFARGTLPSNSVAMQYVLSRREP